MHLKIIFFILFYLELTKGGQEVKDYGVDNSNRRYVPFGDAYSASGSEEKVPGYGYVSPVGMTYPDMEFIPTDILLKISNLQHAPPAPSYKGFWDSIANTFSSMLNATTSTGQQNEGSSTNLKLCFTIDNTYKNAIRDFRSYYKKRYLYVNNFDYEVGYVTHEIVSRYQAMLETFQIVDKLYFQHRNENMAPVTFMFYLYAYIVDMAKQIIHLCNMLHEIDKKYKNKKTKSVFDITRKETTQAHTTTAKKSKSVTTKPSRDYEDELKRKREREQQEKDRKRRLKKYWNKYGKYTTAKLSSRTQRTRRTFSRTTKWTGKGTAPITLPLPKRQTGKRMDFDIHYGWSIEYW